MVTWFAGRAASREGSAVPVNRVNETRVQLLESAWYAVCRQLSGPVSRGAMQYDVSQHGGRQRTSQYPEPAINGRIVATLLERQ